MARPDIENVVRSFLLKVGSDPEARNAVNHLVHEAGTRPVPEARFAEAVSNILQLQEPLKPDDVADFKYHLNDRFQAMPPQNWNLLRSMPYYHSPVEMPPDAAPPAKPVDK